MTDIFELFTGVGLIIDDALGNEGSKDLIWSIKESFESKNIPLLLYTEIPDDDEIKHFKNIGFVLLDWDLKGIGVKYGADEVSQDNIDFLGKLNEICFTPVFIFSVEDPDFIIAKLEESGLYDREKNNYIFVKRKSDLQTSDNLFGEISDWLVATPSVYVLKEWEKSLAKAKQDLFWDFYDINPDWTKVLWETFRKDNINPSIELGELLFDNIHTRISPLVFDSKILDGLDLNSIDPEDIQDIIEGQRYLSYDPEELPNDMIYTGDIFLHENNYLLNVRPQCDCIPRNGQNIDEIELYLINGIEGEINPKKLGFSKKLGTFMDAEGKVTIFPINENKAIRFDLGDFYLRSFGDIKELRIGRLLPPFITKIHQKYALYMQRQGLPRIPVQAIPDPEK